MPINLKDELYAVNKDFTLAENIDMAWSIYGNEGRSEEDRETAQEFLIYAFDLKRVDNLNKQLLTLMEDRNRHKGSNNEYIPGLSPKQLHLNPAELTPEPTAVSRKTSKRNIKALFDQYELLDVNEDSKALDIQRSTRFFSPGERANQRVHIYQGKFYKGNKLFSTEDYVAHDKKSYGAFTINANGELSVFKHHGMVDQIAHSSMNAGSPVVSAGELNIKDGELVAMNTHSGHYQPSLFNVYRALQYFSGKGINIAKTQVYTFVNPSSVRELNVSSTIVNIPTISSWGRSIQFYETQANSLFMSIKESLSQSLQNIKSDTQKYMTTSLTNILYSIKDSVVGSTLTGERKAIAKEVQSIAIDLVAKVTDKDEENIDKCGLLIQKLEDLKEKNNQLSVRNGKQPNTGRLNERINSFLHRAKAAQQLEFPVSETAVIGMKSIH